jgi:formyl-CoA transferase
VLVENFAPGVTERLGLGVEAMHKINPRLVYAQSSGYGQEGLYRDYPAMDLTVQAMSGIMDITGFPEREPVKAGPALVRFLRRRASLRRHRHRTARSRTHRSRAHGGSRDARCGLRISRLNTRHEFRPRLDGCGAHRKPPWRVSESPYNVYPTSDGYLAIICVGEQHWKNLLDAMGRKDLLDDPRFQTLKTRVTHMNVVDDLVEQFHAPIQQAGPVRAADEASRAVRARAHPGGGGERPASASARHAAMDRSSGVRPHRRAVEPDALRRRAAAGARAEQALGANNEDVLGWLGVSRDDVARLSKEGVI